MEEGLQIGFGTYRLKGQVCAEAVSQAIEVGYRLIDTATLYENFEGVGRGIARFDREMLYVISKVWPDSQTSEKVTADLERSLAQLNTPYLDAYLVHWPNHTVPIEETLGAMAQAQDAGKVRDIGLSNVTVGHVRRALQVGVDIRWVQVEMHPQFYDAQLLEFCHANGIGVQAWFPLNKGAVCTEPALVDMGMRYGKSAAQVALRWIVQMGVVPIPGSSNPAHIQENHQIFDFSLSDADMDLICAVAANGERKRLLDAERYGFTDEFDFKQEQCWPL